jgi:hypothetical protein
MTAERRGSVRIRAASVLVAVFVAGGVAAAALLHFLASPPIPATSRLPPPLAELGLTPDQEQEALHIIDKHGPELEAILKEVAPRVRAVQDQVEAELRQILSEEQRKELDRRKRDAPPPPLPGIKRR